MIPLGFKNPNIKHVMSFRRFTYMIPNQQHDPLNLVLKVAVEGKDYTIFVTSGQMRCFLCGEHGHVRQICPSKQMILRARKLFKKTLFKRTILSFVKQLLKRLKIV